LEGFLGRREGRDEGALPQASMARRSALRNFHDTSQATGFVML